MKVSRPALVGIAAAFFGVALLLSVASPSWHHAPWLTGHSWHEGRTASGERFIEFDYDTNVTNLSLIRKQALQIWNALQRSQADSAGYNIALVRVRTPAFGPNTARRTYNFEFRKRGKAWNEVALREYGP
jgi:hypothetical protein